jgi:hypothetical protein
VKVLLTSGGIKNSTIRNALIELLGNHRRLERLVHSHGGVRASLVQTCVSLAFRRWPERRPDVWPLGWRSLGLLALTALSTVPADRWIPWVKQADVLRVDGGDAMDLHHWVRESGLADLLPIRSCVQSALSASIGLSGGVAIRRRMTAVPSALTNKSARARYTAAERRSSLRFRSGSLHVNRPSIDIKMNRNPSNWARIELRLGPGRRC